MDFTFLTQAGPLGLVLFLVVGAFIFSWKLSRIFSNLEDSIDHFGERLETFGTSLDNVVTHDQMRHWIEVYEAKNPECDIPDWPLR